jgi:hypothetical protein
MRFRRSRTIEQYIAHAERQIDQIRRRAINDETIPHHEKVFSIFEPHTEWISKVKARVPQELGLKVCILEDQYGFILHHQVRCFGSACSQHSDIRGQDTAEGKKAFATRRKRDFEALQTSGIVSFY